MFYGTKYNIHVKNHRNFFPFAVKVKNKLNLDTVATDYLKLHELSIRKTFTRRHLELQEELHRITLQDGSVCLIQKLKVSHPKLMKHCLSHS
ncbi:unnamed protein product [Acanthoscelides obtectus]|uniref:Uncharacterized protein n=1 Tax=Acanthoscelides obtectus TaxID=200917 RepID=A0A9P0PTN1_ACAOB|nr:unnamed protein product [Acanthoscelides obtectus]CAK1686748.1 hypothetical protein AOBTE_LOCUS36056 [Acanthoscelides obtectus]